jgi:hypothetical protein
MIGHFFRVINSFGKALSPNAHLILLYLYRQFAVDKANPFLWCHKQAQIDARTHRSAVDELIQGGFAQNGFQDEYLLIDPVTLAPLDFPKRNQRFDGISTFSFPWFVLDYRRLNATELMVYACLWAEKNHRVYLTDAGIASKTGVSERTVKRCLQSLREHRLIQCETKDRASFASVKHKSAGLIEALAWTDRARLQPLGVTPVTRIRQITLCDPERPGVECTPRTLVNHWLDFDQIRDGDLRLLLEQLGVRVINDNGSVLYCEIPGSAECRKVDPATGFSLVPSDRRGGKGKRQHIRQSIWELAERYQGEDGAGIVRQWHDELVKRNAVQGVESILAAA